MNTRWWVSKRRLTRQRGPRRKFRGFSTAVARFVPQRRWLRQRAARKSRKSRRRKRRRCGARWREGRRLVSWGCHDRVHEMRCLRSRSIGRTAHTHMRWERYRPLVTLLTRMPLVAIPQIKKVYRRLAMQYHPDRNHGAGQEEAAEKFRRIAEAWEILGDSDKRARYEFDGSGWTDKSRSRMQFH